MSVSQNPYRIGAPIKIALSGFLFLFLGSLIFLKPYIPKALVYGVPELEDYEHFPSRVVSAGAPRAWKELPQAFKMSNDLENRLIELKTTALVLIDRNEIAYEKYWNDGARAKISNSFSMAKSVLGILTALAIEEKKIPSLQTPIGNFISEWDGREESKITFEQLLSMSSGLNWDESYKNVFSSNAEAYYGSSLVKLALTQRLATKPGERFKYQTGNSILLGVALTRALQQNLSHYLSDKVWTPMGAEQEALWTLDQEEGYEKSFCCLYATARDFAKVGQWFLENTQPQSKHEILKKLVLPAQYSQKPSSFYGLHWWIESTPQGPVYYAKGLKGQYLVLFPHLQRVLVRLGHQEGQKVGYLHEELKSLIEWVESIPVQSPTKR